MRYRLFTAALTAATIWTSCGGNGDGGLMDFETVEAERTVGITDETGAPECRVSLRLAAAKGDPAERTRTVNETIAAQLLGIEGTSLQQAADSFASKYTDDYRRNLAPLYREDRGDERKRAWYDYHYDIRSDTKRGREGVTVYTATVDYYEGGAHGISQRIVMNFDNATGRMLTLADVMAPGYQTGLCALLTEALMEKTGAGSTDELRQRGYLYATDMFAPENFELGEQAVTFVYNPYEIAPYAEGIICLTIDNDDMKDLWK